jgi:hypothetical protein
MKPPVAFAHAYALAYWPAVEEARQAEPSPCTNPAHDHTTTVATVRFTLGGIYQAHEITYPEPVPMRCNDCGQPTHYDEGCEWYIHDDPDSEACFLTSDLDDTPGTTACQLPEEQS